MDADTHTSESIECWLALHHIAGLGNKTYIELLNTFGNTSGILNASRQQLSQLAISDKVITAILDLNTPGNILHAPNIEADMQWLQQDNHHIITYLDPRYPDRLKSLDDAPPLIYIRGDTDYLQQPQIAMVGSRNPTAAGRSTAHEFARHLSNAGITIISGLASGIDGASHEGALEGLAGTTAVVAHGLDIIYPAEHQALAQRITQHGAVISEMPVGTKPQRGLFPKRNRLISALSLGTLVVEAATKSGSLITARFALEQNKEVFAIPGSIHNPMARGCHELIRQGAKLVETANDILEELCLTTDLASSYPQKTRGTTQEKPQEKSKEAHETLDPDHQKLLKCLAYEPATIDELVARGPFNAAEIASMLLILELEGKVASKDGQYTQIA